MVRANSWKRTPTRSLLRIPSRSPIPALLMTGSPLARYSAILVGEEATFEKDGLMKETARSAARRYRGTSEGATRRTT